MERGFLERVESYADIRAWSEASQQEKGDSLSSDYVSEMPNYTHLHIHTSDLQSLKIVWDQWDSGIRQSFHNVYGDLHCLLQIQVDKALIRALVQHWNPAYNCFTFGNFDLTPTIEEYTALLHSPVV